MRGCLALPCIAGALLAPTPRVTTTLRQSQAAPERFERADDAERLAKRIETVLARRTSRLIVVLERLVDGHNYSAIFRTCEALGVQHVWVVAPPPGAARFESRSSLRRKAKAERARQYAANDANRRADDQPVRAGSRKDRRRRKAADAWTADDALDAEHAVHGRGAARFLSVRDFASHAEVIAAVRAVPRCELWCSDLGQDASVLADGAPWLRGPLPHRVALCVEIKILRRVAESSRRPPRHRCDACSMAWRCRFLTARRSQRGHVIVVHPTHWLISTQVSTITSAVVTSLNKTDWGSITSS